jgi:hypothetical protein
MINKMAMISLRVEKKMTTKTRKEMAKAVELEVSRLKDSQIK